MDAKQIFYEKQLQTFKSQDPEEGFFDVVFEIEGKKLYADKFRLGAVSETFKSMLSKNWNSKDEPIEIKGNTFEDFKEFLTFIYSGECNLTDENIFAMIDIAKFYNVQALRNICDEYASKMEHTDENVFERLDVGYKYGLGRLNIASWLYIAKRLSIFSDSKRFLCLSEATIEQLRIQAEEAQIKPEERFDAVYKWAVYQAELQKIASNNDPKFNLNDAIKQKMEKFDHWFRYFFRKMKLSYIHSFVVPKDALPLKLLRSYLKTSYRIYSTGEIIRPLKSFPLPQNMKLLTFFENSSEPSQFNKKDKVNQILNEKQFLLFKSQDPTNEFFDVTFEIDEKKLYADKFRLAAISTTFQSMLSKNWNSKNEPIEIKGNNFEDFKEFLTFIYSGECNLTDQNIFAMIDIAEFYNVTVFKDVCDEFASKIDFTNENIFEWWKRAVNWSLIYLKHTSFVFLQNNFGGLTATDDFLSLDGEFIKELIIFADNKMKTEDIFQAVYKWGEHRAEIKKAESDDDENFNKNEAIKNALKDFLPLIEFRKMELEYLYTYVVPNAFIFPSMQELSDILCYFTSNVTVNATSINGDILQGTLPLEDPAVEIIKSLKNSPSKYDDDNNCICWNSTCVVPPTPSRLIMREEVEWYLIYLQTGNIGIVHQSSIKDTHYILGEMFSENDMKAPDFLNWKIQIV